MLNLADVFDFFPVNQFVSDPDDNPAVQDEIDFLEANDRSGIFDPTGFAADLLPALEAPFDAAESASAELDAFLF